QLDLSRSLLSFPTRRSSDLRTVMDSSVRSKWQVRLAVLLLFVVGFIAGALAMNIYRARHWSPRDGGRGGYEQMLDRLNLTQDQRDRKSTRLNSSHQIISYAV